MVSSDIDLGSDAVRKHQSAKPISGKNFQNKIYQMIFDGLKDYNRVEVAQPSTKINATPPPNTTKDQKLKRISKEKPKTKRYYCLEIHTAAGSIVGDTDIVIFNKKRYKPICIVSCKTSLHSRNTESLYYARLYRDKHGLDLPFFFVTEDINLELGSVVKPTKPRVLFQYENISVYSTNPKTQLGGYIKSISQLIPDLQIMC